MVTSTIRARSALTAAWQISQGFNLSHHVCMDRIPVGLNELVEHWTMLDDERDLIAGKRGPTRLGFTLLLKFFT